MSNAHAAGSSKTYRKVVSETAKKLRINPKHTKFPSEDFKNILDIMDEKSRERALDWYRRGLRRGYDEATTAVAEGELEFINGTLTCPQKVVISTNIRFRGTQREPMDFEFTADELGFE